MAVKVNEQTKDQKQQEESEVKNKESAVSNDILSSLDLPEEDKPEEEGRKVETPKRDVEEAEEESEEDSEEEDQEESESDEDEDEDEDEEVVSKSKFEKRISSEVAKRKVLEAELAEFKESQAAKPNDRKSQLEEMSEAELHTMKVQARDKWFEAKQEGDANLAQEYVKLESEIDEVIKTAPEKFVNSQVKAYNKAVREVSADPLNENINFGDTKEVETIKGIAGEIYQKYPELQKLKSGQATALKMAVDHHRSTKGLIRGKSKETELKRKNNKLKRKTALDSSKLTGQANSQKSKRLFEKARKTRTMYDQQAALESVLDVDSYLPK